MRSAGLRRRQRSGWRSPLGDETLPRLRRDACHNRVAPLPCGATHNGFGFLGVYTGRIPENVAVCDQHDIRASGRERGKTLPSAFDEGRWPPKILRNTHVHDVGCRLDLPHLHQACRLHSAAVGTREDVCDRDLQGAHGVADGAGSLPASVCELTHSVRITTRPITRLGNPVSLRPVGCHMTKIDVVPALAQCFHQCPSAQRGPCLRRDDLDVAQGRYGHESERDPYGKCASRLVYC